MKIRNICFMINKTHTILYVKDQAKSALFYKLLLGRDAYLNVPGMTEFELTDNSILGLMPSSGIAKLLINKINEPEYFPGKPRAEIYLIVDDINKYIKNAKGAGAILLDDLKKRDWGHNAIYFEDLDGYIIAFAEIIH